jgi:signal transduction histidine kinase
MNIHDVTSILIVDDRPENLLALEAVLQPLGQNLVQCRSGNEALRRLLGRDFAVIIIDVNMPGMDGFEIASLIRQRERSEHTPIIFLTAQADADHLTRGYSLGAVDYILSPVNPDVLKTKVAVFVDLHRRTLAAQREADELAKLNAAALALASALSIEQMAQSIADEARKMIGARESLVVVRVEGEWSQQVHAVSVANTDMTGELSEELQTILETAEIDLAIPVRLSDAQLRDHAFFRESLQAIEAHVRLRGWLSAPLATRDGSLIGFVQLSDKEQGDFDETDERLIMKLAEVASNTIDNELHRAARQANRMKDEFLATLSHELRNPLNAILGWTRLLRTGELDRAATAHAFEVIERNVRLQAKLMEDLLDLSRIQNGSVRLDRLPVDLCTVVDGVVESLRPLAEAKRIDFKCEVEAEGMLITGDADRLAQVTWNLVSNAIKFTPAGGEIQVRVRRIGSYAELTVIDNGIGIEPDFLPHVFERFRRGEGTGEAGQEGLGLGLAIVRQLVELHGGEVRAESRGRGTGAQFIVTLPVLFVETEGAGTGPAGGGAGGDAISSGQRSALAELPRLDGMRILIVDDDQDSRDFLRAALTHQGADVVVAASSGEALAMVNRVGPDVLVSDIAMPGEDGCTLIRKLRARGANNGGEVPAMALTGSVRGKDRDRVLAAGFQAFLPKPVELAELVTTISQLAAPELPGTAPSRS